jgi:hypothetical protein
LAEAEPHAQALGVRRFFAPCGMFQGADIAPFRYR